MVEIGKYNHLEVVRKLGSGVYLDGGEAGELLLAVDQAPENCFAGDTIEVFLYYNSDKKTIATTQKPYAAVGEFACLKVVDVLEMGAFLDWGLPKDLFVPASEQKDVMEKGESYVVYVYKDEQRDYLAASSRLDAFLDQEPASFQENDKVDLLICHQTDLGFNAIINNAFWGLLYQDEVFQELEYGQRVEGFIKKMRKGGKIDLSLHIQGYHRMDELEQKILQWIDLEGGACEITDKSSPEVIYDAFGVSKKKYKMALGALYKDRRIVIEGDVIKLKG